MMNIVPYKGFDNITFEMSFDEVKGLLREKQMKFNTENWPNKGCYLLCQKSHVQDLF